MKLTVKAKLIMTTKQVKLIEATAKEYISTINTLVASMTAVGKRLNLSSKDVAANLPSVVKNQAIRDAKSVYSKSKKLGVVPILKRPVCIWNNQNFSIKDNTLSFPLLIEGKCTRLNVKLILSEYQKNLLQNEQGTLRLSCKNYKWIAQITVEVPEQCKPAGNVMGVDLGIKVPAVAVLANGKTKFFGNGRQNKYIRRQFKLLRRKLGNLKKPQAIKKLNDKEQRWMKDQDHKISRAIVNFALENNVSTIHMELLANIRNTAKTSRKNNYSLHSWSFYRLAMYIKYKAALVGIKVAYVNPAYTSQTCLACGKLNKAKDRNYQCSCGFKTHRDRIGAMNIITAPVVDGNSLPA